MADLYVASAVDVVSGTARKTILQLTSPSTTRPRIRAIDLSLDGVTPSNTPILVELAIQTSAGTGGSSVTPVAKDYGAPASLCTAQKGPAGTWTGEPTTTTVIKSFRITPAGATLLFPIPLGDEIVLGVSSRLGLLVTAGATVNCCADFEFLD